VAPETEVQFSPHVLPNCVWVREFFPPLPPRMESLTQIPCETLSFSHKNIHFRTEQKVNRLRTWEAPSYLYRQRLSYSLFCIETENFLVKGKWITFTQYRKEGWLQTFQAQPPFYLPSCALPPPCGIAYIGHEGSVGMSVCKVHISATRWRFYT
jgi:hypothetical protein